jgi:hypothetical protein
MNFITFGNTSGVPETWNIELTQVTTGGNGLSGCAAPISTTVNSFCTPPGSAFNEENESCSGNGTVSGTSCQVVVSLVFDGIAYQGPGTTGPSYVVQGTFSTTFSGTNLETINTDIGNFSDVVTSDSGSLVLTAISTTPEPMTSVLVGAGLLALGLINRKRPGIKS